MAKSKSVCEVDKEGNNALHLAASIAVDIDWLNAGKSSWFEYVKNSMPRGLSGRYNGKMKTPEDIFSESHKELMTSEGDWVAKTSQACSVVLTLVLSVAFATRTSVPGGYYAKCNYAIFAASSFMALFLSLMSTIIFLSIAASRSQSVPSRRSVPLKTCFGMYFMFSSIVFLWISFWASHSFTGDGDSRKSGDGLPIYIFFLFLIFLLVLTQLPTFFGPVLSSIFQIPARRHKATRPIEYRKAKNNQEFEPL